MGSMDMVILRIDKRISDKAILMHQSNMRGCRTLDFKGNVMGSYGTFFLSVVRGMNVGIWPVEIVLTDVVRWPHEEQFPYGKGFYRKR